MFSRSVASTASVPRRQAATITGTPDPHIHNLRGRNITSDKQSLAELWDTFVELRDRGEVASFDSDKLFLLGRGITAGRVTSSTSEDANREALVWGKCLEGVLYELQGRPLTSSVKAFHFDCLAAEAKALQGLFEEAISMAARLPHNLADNEHSMRVLDVYRHIFFSLLRHTSPSRSFDYYLENRHFFRQLLNAGSPHGVKTLTARYDGPFFKGLSLLFRSMVSPAAFLAQKRRSWHKAQIGRAGRIMLHVLCQDGLAEDALAVYEELISQGNDVFYGLRHELVRCLVRAERFERANIVYADATPEDGPHREAERRSYDATGLYLSAHQGDVVSAEEIFSRISATGSVLPSAMTLVMHASAMQGNVRRVIELFESFFSDGSPLKPNIYHYGAVIHAFAQRDDLDGMNKWIKRMKAGGHALDVSLYNTLLKSLAYRKDVVSMQGILKHMRGIGISPDIVSYTTILKALADRRDVVAAEAIFKRMIREGIVPDRMAVTTLMNAHAEAGSWKGVVQVFNYLRGVPEKELRLGIEVFNTLLKAYILIGAPLHVVTGIFQRIEMANIKPTSHTFALLILSACESGRMDVASRLFVEMEALAGNQETDVQITVHVLTIIMTGYLRRGKKARARAVYDDMLARGIRPTAHTFASILKAYSNKRHKNNFRIGQEFLASLTATPVKERTWGDPESRREDWLAFVYAPMLRAHAKGYGTKEVEGLYEEYRSAGGQATIGTLTLLLDVYRRTNDIEGVHRVWPQILEIALARTNEVDALLDPEDVQSVSSLRRLDLLCIPLSIYIDAVSRAGRHLEIAHTWNTLRNTGFQFDAHNWNHLAIALVRAGEYARAFEVLEKVILPYQIQAHNVIITRPGSVSSPLLFSDEEARRDFENEPFTIHAERTFRKRLRIRRVMRGRLRVSERTNKGESGDYTQRLQLMQRISPAWNAWRPHTLTLRMLARVLKILSAGRLLKPRARTPWRRWQRAGPVTKTVTDARAEAEAEAEIAYKVLTEVGMEMEVVVVAEEATDADFMVEAEVEVKIEATVRVEPGVRTEAQATIEAEVEADVEATTEAELKVATEAEAEATAGLTTTGAELTASVEALAVAETDIAAVEVSADSVEDKSPRVTKADKSAAEAKAAKELLERIFTDYPRAARKVTEWAHGQIRKYGRMGWVRFGGMGRYPRKRCWTEYKFWRMRNRKRRQRKRRVAKLTFRTTRRIPTRFSSSSRYISSRRPSTRHLSSRYTSIR
ncbi:hypothetical protein M0805_009073 [Coniferiporia weirii]|nr:hypothetical protein M0805_009073 [Coniferiporia weirii]